MGHLHSKTQKRNKLKTSIRKSSIKILHIDAKIDNSLTEIDEMTASVLKYKTPHFRFLLVFYCKLIKYRVCLKKILTY